MGILIILHHIHRITLVNILQSRHLNINQSLSPTYVFDALHLIQRMQNMLHHVGINHQIRRKIQSQIFQHTNTQIQAMNISAVGHVFRTQINSYHRMTFTPKKVQNASSATSYLNNFHRIAHHTGSAQKIVNSSTLIPLLSKKIVRCPLRSYIQGSIFIVVKFAIRRIRHPRRSIHHSATLAQLHREEQSIAIALRN